jgi:hypothetical protein
MHAWLDGLTNSGFGQWVQLSPFGYPVLLTFHSIGLAMVVGLLVVIDLRVLGVARGTPLPAFRSLLQLVWIGFWVNAISGVAIFVSDAAKYYYSTTFRLKLLSIALGLIALVVIRSWTIVPGTELQQEAAPARAKWVAALSLLSWLGAIVAGRLMAYVD